ncbi:MAG: hypothetical protein ABFD81_07130 [Syntrophaceae bacterium]
MFLSVLHKPLHQEALRHEVIDLNTGKPIPRVVWANDETGRYRQNLIDEEGRRFLDTRGRIASKIFTGNIELRRVK